MLLYSYNVGICEKEKERSACFSYFFITGGVNFLGTWRDGSLNIQRNCRVKRAISRSLCATRARDVFVVLSGVVYVYRDAESLRDNAGIMGFLIAQLLVNRGALMFSLSLYASLAHALFFEPGATRYCPTENSVYRAEKCFATIKLCFYGSVYCNCSL